MYLRGFMNICIVGVLHKMIPPFSMFQDGRNYILFPGGGGYYNGVKNIIKLVYIAVEMCSELERDYSTKQFSSFYQSV